MTTIRSTDLTEENAIAVSTATGDTITIGNVGKRGPVGATGRSEAIRVSDRKTTVRNPTGRGTNVNSGQIGGTLVAKAGIAATKAVIGGKRIEVLKAAIVAKVAGPMVMRAGVADMVTKAVAGKAIAMAVAEKATTGRAVVSSTAATGGPLAATGDGARAGTIRIQDGAKRRVMSRSRRIMKPARLAALGVAD